MKKLKLAIIGQGRSGRNIHGSFLKTERNTYFDVVAVVDADAQRRERALAEYPGCQVYADYRELYTRDDLDLVVNATYSHMHGPITKDLLLHKLNVLVEKPFARTYYECCDLIATAKAMGVTLAVFQQSFLAPFFTDTKKIIASGKLGDIKQVSIHYNGFSRRWDWQTLQSKMGGGIYNTGPHPIGLALEFLDFHPETRVAYSTLDCVLTSGDSDDHAKIILTAPGKPLVDIEVSSIDAFSDYNLKLQGSKGTYQCTTGKYKMKYIPDGANPPRPVQAEFLQNEEGLPTYCSEKLVTVEESGDFSGSAFDTAVHDFYAMLHDTLTTGAPLVIPPEYAAQVINVIETVHGQNPLPVLYPAED